MTKLFTKTVEDFKCEHCGQEIKGNGYTNHCPHCLWSKHVDINPGDRMCNCRGMMQPTEITQKNGEYVILHKCLKCGFERKNKFNENDNFNALLDIVKKKNI